MLGVAISVMTISAFAKENTGKNENQSNPVDFHASIADTGKGSVFSEGNLIIIVGVSSATVFGFGGFFIGKAVGKKKKPATAGTENTDEE